MTTTLPLYAARLSCPPVIVFPDSSGACLRSAALMTLIAPLPLTKLELPESEPVEDDEQAASVSATTAAPTSATALRNGRRRGARVGLM